jgi:hypothetical protein
MAVLLLSSCQRKPSGDNPEDWIDATDFIDTAGMNLYWQYDNIRFVADNNATLSMYVNAEKDNDGVLFFDDGQDWLLLMETSLGKYPLFPRQYLQFGEVSCSAFHDAENDFHVIITVRQTAGYRIYDCVFDKDKKAFKRSTVYDTENINFIFSEHGQQSTAEKDMPEKAGLLNEKEIIVIREGIEEVFTGTLTVSDRYSYAIYLLPDYELREMDGFDLIAPKQESQILPEINMWVYEADQNTPIPESEGEYGITPLTDYRRFIAGGKTFEARLTYPYESAEGGAMMLNAMAETICTEE